ncbi:hypothetical protein J4407_01475 [Candidatus Pacearchaeota archaeon]|nr:hypothetical protein [Candidatus Pacearchaeota archaeon]
MSFLDRLFKDDSTINFPRGVDGNEAKKFFEFIREKIGNDCRISLNYSGELELASYSDRDNVKTMYGDITVSREDRYSSTSFSLVKPQKKPNGVFSGLKFRVPVGFDLEGLHPFERDLCGRVREITKEYFTVNNSRSGNSAS